MLNRDEEQTIKYKHIQASHATNSMSERETKNDSIRFVVMQKRGTAIEELQQKPDEYGLRRRGY